MKKTKNLLAIVAMMLLIAMLSVMGTVAYLSAKTQEVTNTFTVGNIDITLAETTGNDYKVIPGNPIEKDPEVTVVEGSEDCWVFVKVTESDNWPENQNIYWNIAEGWTQVPDEDDVWYRQVLADADVKTFDVLAGNKVYVSQNLTKDEVDNIIAGLTVEGEVVPFTMTVVAYAVQLDGFENDVAGAWEQAQVSYVQNANSPSVWSNNTNAVGE